MTTSLTGGFRTKSKSAAHIIPAVSLDQICHISARRCAQCCVRNMQTAGAAERTDAHEGVRSLRTGSGKIVDPAVRQRMPAPHSSLQGVACIETPKKCTTMMIAYTAASDAAAPTEHRQRRTMCSSTDRPTTLHFEKTNTQRFSDSTTKVNHAVITDGV